MHRLHGRLIHCVLLSARVGLKTIRRFPVGDRSSDRYALIGNSHGTAQRRIPPRIGGGLTFFPCTRFAVRVNSSLDWRLPIL